MDNSVNEIARRYAQAVIQRYKPKAIYLYGSYANGAPKEDSDIDIAVVFEPLNSDEYISVFSGLSSIAAKVDYNIEPNLLIDDGDYCKYGILAEVMKTGIKINV